MLILFLVISFISSQSNVCSDAKTIVSEYDRWRGLGRLDDEDMLQIGNWVESMTYNDSSMDAAMSYYWVRNELYYPFAGVIRGIFGAFNATAIRDGLKLPRTFLNGLEITLHYFLLKSYPIIGRRGGVRGNGKDRKYLLAAMEPLSSCFLANTKPNGKDAKVLFEKIVFPYIPSNATSSNKTERKTREVDVNETIIEETVSESFEDDESEEPIPPTNDFIASIDSNGELNEVDRNETDILGRGLVKIKLNHGNLQTARKTNIKIRTLDKNVLENIPATCFWLIYELIPHLCKWNEVQTKAVNFAIDKIIGLIVSLFLYDQIDYAEEYERIFLMKTHKFEELWTKLEGFARKNQIQNHLKFCKPFSDTASNA